MPANDALVRLEQRLEALETRLAYQEHWLDMLDQAVAGQQQRLTQLERLGELMQRRLREQLQGQEDTHDNGDFRPEDEIPPHY